MSSVGDAHPITKMSEMPPAVAGFGEAPAGLAETGITPGEIWRILKQRKLLVLLASIVLYTLVVLATLITWRWFPAYPARAVLQLRPPQEDVFKPTDPLVDPNIMEQLLTTEARKIKRLDVLQEVLSLPEIRDTDFYRWYDGFEECLFELQRQLHVIAVPDTQLIEVSLACRDREEARKIVDTVVRRYEEQYKRTAEDSSRRRFEEMKNTRDELEKDLANKQQELSDFRTQTDVGQVESATDIQVRRIADQSYVVNQYDARAADLLAQLDTVINIDPRDLPVTPADRIIVETDPLLRLRRQQVESMDVEIKVALALTAGPESRYIQQVQARRDAYYALEVARREQLLDDLRERQVDGLKQELARVRSVQARVQDQLQELEARLADLDASRVRYDALAADEERLQKNLEDLEAAVLEFQHLLAAAPRSPRLTVVQYPRKAVKPSRPAYKLWLIGGVFIALFGGAGIALLRELTDKAVRTPIDVARHGRLSVLGCIPQLDDEEADVDTVELATKQAPHSLMAEAFRQVRANLVFSGPAEVQRVLLITSPGPGNGKTAAAINLAMTLAHAGQKVLLVDSNFRRPAIRGALPNTRPEGLSNLLIGQATLEQLVTHTDVPNLSVLTSGPMPPTPAELLGSAYMGDLIEQAKSKYDRVIFDGPPVLLISDALVLATQVDGVIVVARAVENTKGGLRRAREQLDKIGAHVIGAILNGVQTRSGGYFRQQYRDFYEYTSDETIPRELPGMEPELPPPDDEPS